jgi:LacI family transcriptional regulator
MSKRLTMQTKAPTIKEVARAAGVSIATVSKIVNNLPVGYSSETRARVLTAIEELGYNPNTAARTIKTNRTGTIGVLLPDLSSMFMSSILRGIEMTSQALGLNVIVSHTESNGHLTMEYLRVLHEKRVDGILFASEVFRDEYRSFTERRGIPVVLVATEAGGIPFVKVDDRSACRDGTAALIALGHRRIAMIAGSLEDPIAGAPRVAGYLDALAGAGIRAEEDWVINASGFTFGDIEKCAEAVDALVGKVDAFFCASDELAAGLLNRCLRSGISIPGELSIMGFDDLPLTTMVTPALSTVSQSLAELGAAAATMLADILGGKAVPTERFMPHRVVLRESTATGKEAHSP